MPLAAELRPSPRRGRQPSCHLTRNMPYRPRSGRSPATSASSSFRTASRTSSGTRATEGGYRPAHHGERLLSLVCPPTPGRLGSLMAAFRAGRSSRPFNVPTSACARRAQGTSSNATSKAQPLFVTRTVAKATAADTDRLHAAHRHRRRPARHPGARSSCHMRPSSRRRQGE